MIKILKAFNKIETQSRAVLRCKVTQEVHWVREGVLEIDFLFFLKAVLLLLSSQDSSEGKTVQEWWHVKNSTKQKKEIGSTPVIGQKKKSLLLEKSMHAVSILTIRWKLSCLPHTHIPLLPLLPLLPKAQKAL